MHCVYHQACSHVQCPFVSHCPFIVRCRSWSVARTALAEAAPRREVPNLVLVAVVAGPDLELLVRVAVGEVEAVARLGRGRVGTRDRAGQLNTAVVRVPPRLRALAAGAKRDPTAIATRVPCRTSGHVIVVDSQSPASRHRLVPVRRMSPTVPGAPVSHSMLGFSLLQSCELAL